MEITSAHGSMEITSAHGSISIQCLLIASGCFVASMVIGHWILTGTPHILIAQIMR